MKRLGIAALAALAVLSLGAAAPAWTVLVPDPDGIGPMHQEQRPLWGLVRQAPGVVVAGGWGAALDLYLVDFIQLAALGVTATGAAAAMALGEREKAPPERGAP